jgi:hypothetical protein
MFDLESKNRANGRPRVLVCDGFGIHEMLEILEFHLGNNIVLCRVPIPTSHKLQLCDVAVFAPLRAFYRDEVERLERAGVTAIGKEHFTLLYSRARSKSDEYMTVIALSIISFPTPEAPSTLHPCLIVTKNTLLDIRVFSK